MDDDKKRAVLVVLIIGCLALAGGITYWTQFRGGPGGGSVEPVVLLCLNKECGHVKETNTKDMWEGVDRSAPPMEMGPMTFPCPQCGKKSMVMAEKCEKCAAVFIPNYANPRDYPDRCPKCKYSKMEEEEKSN